MGVHLDEHLKLYSCINTLAGSGCQINTLAYSGCQKGSFFKTARQANSNWSQDIREVFKIQPYCMTQKVAVNVRNVKSLLKRIIEKEWKLELESKPNLSVYKTFKTTFETEGYLYRHLKQQDRFLWLILHLRIEIVRYQ